MTLAGLSDSALFDWLLARMREQRIDPPICVDRLERVDDYVRHEAQRAMFEIRKRIELAALIEVGARDLRAGPDARAARNLAALVDGLEIREAAPVLQQIAERGSLGGHDFVLDPAAEEMVLFALAGLQEPDVLYLAWEAMWQRQLQRLWPVVTSGLRLSNPKRALNILELSAARFVTHPGLPRFPLGEVLWSFSTDERLEDGAFTAAVAELSREE